MMSSAKRAKSVTSVLQSVASFLQQVDDIQDLSLLQKDRSLSQKKGTNKYNMPYFYSNSA